MDVDKYNALDWTVIMFLALEVVPHSFIIIFYYYLSETQHE